MVPHSLAREDEGLSRFEVPRSQKDIVENEVLKLHLRDKLVQLRLEYAILLRLDNSEFHPRNESELEQESHCDRDAEEHVPGVTLPPKVARVLLLEPLFNHYELLQVTLIDLVFFEVIHAFFMNMGHFGIDSE